MDRRLDERVQVQFEARVTGLSGREPPALGRVLDISRSGISVAVPLQLAPGDLVELEMADSVVTGRVVYCNRVNSQFRIGVGVEHVRLGETGLSNLLQRTLIEALPDTPGLEPTGTYSG